MPQWQKNLYVLFIAEFLSITGFQSVLPFLSLYVKELEAGFGSTEFWVGAVFAVQALTMAITAPLWGSLADRWGRKLMLQRAMFGGAVLLGLMALVNTVEQLVLLRAIQGVLTGTIPAAYTLVATSAPNDRTGYAMGVIQMGIWLGASIGPFLGGIVADTFDFNAAFYMTAVYLLLGGVAVTLFVKEEFVSGKTDRLSRVGLVRDWLDILRTPAILPVLSVRFLIQMPEAVIVPFLPLFVATLLASQTGVPTITGLTVGVTAAAGAVSSIFLGRLGDRYGHRRLLLACALAAVVAQGLMTFVNAEWQLVLLFAALGVTMGGMLPTATALLSSAAPRDQMGLVFGIDSSIVASARMIAPLLGATAVALLELRGVFLLAALIFVLVASMAAWQQHRAHPPVYDPSYARGHSSD